MKSKKMELEQFCEMLETLKISGKCDEKYIEKIWKKSHHRNSIKDDYYIQQVLYYKLCELDKKKGKNNKETNELFSIIEYFIKKKFNKRLCYDIKFKTWIMDIDIRMDN
jgi:hypothetical protein|tara:strand:- start:222 stop:548 length:327 start_codon:yes stop_codon:yes gene_type:complete